MRELYNRMSEHQHQKALIDAFKLRRAPGAVLFAIPNGGARDAITGRMLKEEGVEAGAPDLFCAALGKPCFFIEMKKTDGRLSAAQKEFHPKLIAVGLEVITAYGYLEAVSILEDRGIIRRPKSRVTNEQSNSIEAASEEAAQEARTKTKGRTATKRTVSARANSRRFRAVRAMG